MICSVISCFGKVNPPHTFGLALHDSLPSLSTMSIPTIFQRIQEYLRVPQLRAIIVLLSTYHAFIVGDEVGTGSSRRRSSNTHTRRPFRLVRLLPAKEREQSETMRFESIPAQSYLGAGAGGRQIHAYSTPPRWVKRRKASRGRGLRSARARDLRTKNRPTVRSALYTCLSTTQSGQEHGVQSSWV